MNRTATRFSEASVIEHLEKKCLYYEDRYGFTSSTGSIQVDGAEQRILIAYGEYAAYCEMLETVRSNDI